MSQMFNVKSIRNVSWGTSIARASIDLEILPHGIILRDCLLKEGQFGWFLSAPSKKLKESYTNQTTGKEVEYLDLVFFPKTIRDELNAACVEAYDPAGNYPELATTTTTTTTTTGNDSHPMAEHAQELFDSTDYLVQPLAELRRCALMLTLGDPQVLKATLRNISAIDMKLILGMKYKLTVSQLSALIHRSKSEVVNRAHRLIDVVHEARRSVAGDGLRIADD